MFCTLLVDTVGFPDRGVQGGKDRHRPDGGQAAQRREGYQRHPTDLRIFNTTFWSQGREVTLHCTALIHVQEKREEGL